MAQASPLVLPTNFFAQLIVRLFSKTPKFFQYIRVASLVLGASSAALNYLLTQISLPSFLAWLPNDITQAIAVVSVILTSLPVDPTVAVTPDVAAKLSLLPKK